ncbi:trypsin-like cysteine/serine peptidase domain-containing protein [Emericellopsis atlantica]|uniref:Trypsin-like cysteine/serine peptidase domain-containing protein n=1 Tax=Emericellopsis atlantica TaxID=2614577 RepID=A0A9P7ZUY6_9HYPO|nr:trypsin-like cysteine/serine peptidase domain-containing protein [Emericellopsis atlantica]KAG9258829.1 trypsin-like cysteine/serine peptidase domain-containing protein [Emericellopsis atlantica]
MVSKLALAAAALSTFTGVSAVPVPQTLQEIVGGEPAAQGEFPYIVSLQRSGSHSCGGALLNADTVVTAAHCSVNVNVGILSVTAGTNTWSSGGTEVGVSSIAVHPQYDDSSLDNDVAIWKLSQPIDAGSGIGYVSLPSSGSDPAAGSSTTIAGWGATREGGASSSQLLKVSVPVVDRDECNSAYGGDITDAMFCAGLPEGGKDACQGDSGGPIVDNSGALIGVVSWGQGCARPGYPGVYTRIANFISFINSNA